MASSPLIRDSQVCVAAEDIQRPVFIGAYHLKTDYSDIPGDYRASREHMIFPENSWVETLIRALPLSVKG